MIHLWRNQLVGMHKQKLKTVSESNFKYDADTFLKISFFFRCFSHFFAIANQLPGFAIDRLANAEDFFNVNILSKCKLNINMSICDYSSKYICIVCYLKLRFYCLPCSAMSILN